MSGKNKSKKRGRKKLKLSWKKTIAICKGKR